MKAKFGRYVFLKKLAVGGMAEVYLARRLSFGGFAKFVVVKRLLPEHKGRTAYERLFLAEARTGALLNHPNVVALYDLGKLDDAYFMAMEYVEGVSVADLMSRLGREGAKMPLGCAMRVVCGVAAALQHVHHTLGLDGEPLRIIHHDISPHNILVSYEGDVKLLDFGVATRLGRAAPGGRRGKFGYMSPEAVHKQEIDQRSDLYSLGVVLYELTLGRRLFKGGDVNETMELAATPVVPPPTRVDPYYPASLEEVVLKVLARDPAARYPEAQAFLKALGEVTHRLGCDTSAEALAGWLRNSFGKEIEAHRTELARLARASEPKRRTEPEAVTENPPAAPAVDPDAAPPEVDAAEAADAADPDLPPPVSEVDAADPDPPPPVSEADAADLEADEAEVAVVSDSGALALASVEEPTERAEPAAAPTPAPPTPAAPTTPNRRRLLLAAAAVAAALGLGRHWGERAARGDATLGTLRVVSKPEGARAYSGERLLGITPFVDRRARVGVDVPLRVVQPGYQVWTGQVRLEPDQRHVTVVVPLSPEAPPPAPAPAPVATAPSRAPGPVQPEAAVVTDAGAATPDAAR